MTRRRFSRRLTAVLLALALALSLVPAALAASCPQCGGELTYTDNGDGSTHTVSCSKDGTLDPAAPHDFGDGGRCAACGAMDYSQVHIVLPEDAAFTAALGDKDAALSLEGVRLTLGGEDVTGEYALSYSWYYQGSALATGQRCAPPPSVIGSEGDYDFVCFVTAVPGNALAGKTISASCTVSLHVRDLLSVNAVVSSRDLYLSLGDETSRTPVSVADQIAQAVTAAGGQADCVVFDDAPDSSAGALKFTVGERYRFSSGEGSSLSQVRFEPGSAGAYTVGFTAYDQAGKAYPGLLTIAVEQSLGSVDLLYVTEKGAAVSFAAEDFQAFWTAAYPQGELRLVRFTVLPAASAGTLRQGYSSAARPGAAVSANESCYVAAGESAHPLLSQVAFVPDSRFSGPVAIPFDAYGSDGRGNQTYRSGRIFLFVNAAAPEAVTCSVAAGGSARLSAGSFQSVYRAVTGSHGTGFYIRLLEVPASGVLSADGVRLTDAAIQEKAFPYSALSGLSYAPGSAKKASARYAAYSAAGELLYVGAIEFSVQEGTANPYADVSEDDWFCRYVLELTKDGVIGGVTDTVYAPGKDTTWGEALKLVMLAVGYDAQPSEGGHWAGGYRKAALADGLIEQSVSLNASITRGELAQLAAAAMKLTLPGTLTASPFQDVSPSSAAAPAIAALYAAGIVEGTALSDGRTVYRPDAPLSRGEAAAIVWRIREARTA